jgi:hypothetical protein
LFIVRQQADYNTATLRVPLFDFLVPSNPPSIHSTNVMKCHQEKRQYARITTSPSGDVNH